jgi:tetratricopeptide (TPR) repeat protein
MEQMPTHTPRALLVFLEGIDRHLVSPLMDRGILPTFQRLFSGGAGADLVSLPPYNPAMLFASAVTGLRAAHHGITGFPTPEDPVFIDGKMPQSALWNAFKSQGKQSLVICDAPYVRAGEIDGVFVDGAFLHGVTANGVFPADLAEELASLRVTEKSLDPRVVKLVCPNLDAESAAADPLSMRLVECLCGLYTTCNTAVSLMETEKWSLAVVQTSFVENMLALFGRIADSPDAPLAKQRRYEGVIENSLRLVDLLLSRLIEAAGDKTVVFTLSTRARAMLDPAAFTAYPLVNPGFGFFVAAGPSIRKGVFIGTASLTDVVPTVLASLGMIPERSDGYVLREIFDEPDKVSETAPGFDDRCENPPPLPQCSVNRFHLAVDLMESGHPAEALPILEKVALENPESVSFAFWKACCETDTGRFDSAWESAAALRDNDSPKIPQIRLMLAILAGRAGRSDEVIALLGGKAAPGVLPNILVSMFASALMSNEKWEDAFDFLKAELAIRPSAGVWQSIANCYLHYGLYKDAELAARHVIANNPRLAIGHVLLARALNRLHREEESWAAVIEARRLGPDFPFVKSCAESLYPARAAKLQWPANPHGIKDAKKRDRRTRTISEAIPSFSPPNADERARAAALLNTRDMAGEGWNLRVWRSERPARIVGVASWKLVEDGKRAHLFVRAKPFCHDSEKAGAMLRPLIGEIRASGATSILLTEPEGNLPDGAVDAVCASATHWSDEDWIADAEKLGRKLAAYEAVLAEAVARGWRLRPLNESDWPVLRDWSVGAGFLLENQFAHIRQCYSPALSAAAESPESIGGMIAVCRHGLNATIEFITGNPGAPERLPIATAMLLLHLVSCKAPPIDEIFLTTNLNRSRNMHVLAKRTGMRLVRECRHHMLTL